jgi:hypothetical protein
MDQRGLEWLLDTGWDDALMFDVVNFDGCDYALISGVGDSLEDLSLAVGSPAWTSCVWKGHEKRRTYHSEFRDDYGTVTVYVSLSTPF